MTDKTDALVALADEAAVEDIAALLYEEATDEPWTVAGVEHCGPDRAYYRKLARKVIALAAPAAGAAWQGEAERNFFARDFYEDARAGRVAWPSTAASAVAVDEAMVKRACSVYDAYMQDVHGSGNEADDFGMRAALTAAIGSAGGVEGGNGKNWSIGDRVVWTSRFGREFAGKVTAVIEPIAVRYEVDLDDGSCCTALPHELAQPRAERRDGEA